MGAYGPTRSVLLASQVGNTPLLRLANIARIRGVPPEVEVYAKAEWFNPSGSVKDRAALSMLLDGERRGLLTPGKVILVAGAVLHAHGKTDIQTADQAAAALAPIAGPFGFVLFAVGLIGTGLLAIPILSGSAAYALKEFFRLPGNLAAKPQYRPTFYAIMAAAVVVGGALNFVGIDPILVFRQEDYELLMHWEHPMDPEPGGEAAPPAPPPE